MEFEYELTEKDYINFNIFHFGNSKAVKRSLLVQRIIGPLFFIVFGYLYYQIETVSLPLLILVIIALSAVWIILYPMRFKGYITRNTKRMIEEGNNALILGKHHVTMNKNGFTDKTSRSQTSLQWKNAVSFQEDKDNLYLYHSPSYAYIIPKDKVGNVEEVKKFIQTNLPANI